MAQIILIAKIQIISDNNKAILIKYYYLFLFFILFSFHICSNLKKFYLFNFFIKVFIE